MKLINWDSFWLLLAIISIIGLVLPAYLYHRKLRIWRNQLSIDKHEAIFNQLYRRINGFKTSSIARQYRNYDELALTYGEIQFQSFIALLSLCRPNEKTIFYDLGSGIGKAVIAAAMVFPLKKAIGIECLLSMDVIANQIKQQLINIHDYKNKQEVIHFARNNFMEHDWKNGTLVFINSTAIIGDQWSHLLKKLEQLKQNAIVITTTKSIPLESYELIYCADVIMSWGIVKAFIHEKITPSSFETWEERRL